MSLSINVSGLNEAIEVLHDLPESIRANVSSDMEDAIAYAASYAQSIAPVRTGYYQDNIGYEKVGDFEFCLYAGAPYSMFVEYGTMPSPGRYVPAIDRRLINPDLPGFGMHPGTPAQYILTQAMDINELAIESAIESGIDKAIDP